MLGLCIDRPAHRYLCKTAFMLTPVREIITYYNFSSFFQRLCKFARGWIPLKDACIMSVNPVLVLVKRSRTVTCQLGDLWRYMIVFQFLDKFKSFFYFCLIILKLTVYNPVVAVFRLQVIYHQHRTVIFCQCQRIIAVIILGKCLACCQKVCVALWHFYAYLVKRGLIPIEDPACHRYRHCSLCTGDLAHFQIWAVKLGHIDLFGIVIQIQKCLAVFIILVDPVPVYLIDILRGACHKRGGHLLFPAIPCCISIFDLYARIFFLECLDRLLRRHMPVIAAPPGDRQCTCLVIPVRFAYIFIGIIRTVWLLWLIIRTAFVLFVVLLVAAPDCRDCHCCCKACCHNRSD